MHKVLPEIYYFINKFDPNHISKLDKKIALIYRNYNKKISFELVRKIKTFCKLNKRIFILANNYKLALKMDLDGVYIPSFNNDLKHLNYLKKKKFHSFGFGS
jgi:thiamine-phosphate pyrophosphorylase